jgi:predicted secreted acid phosphatase
MPRVRRRSVLIAIAAVLAGTSAVAVAAENDPVDYTPTKGGSYTSIRPTGLGLPNIGIGGTTGAGELQNALRIYHDNGLYDRDLAAVAASAKAYLAQRLTQQRTKAKKVKKCTVRYRRLRTKKIRGRVYRRVRSCKRRTVTPPRLTGKPALVLDIDETALSNYSGLNSSNFSASGLVAPAVAGNSPAIGPTLDLYRYARSQGVSVFFVTGRPSAVSDPTASNLRNVGYSQGWEGLQFKPGDIGTEAYKAGARAALQQRGYDVVVNMGDQESDLDGGHADRAFKLPNPFYFIAD